MGLGTAAIDTDRMMTEDEARHCVNEIKRGMFDIRYLVLDLHQREGWRALGYRNWQECKEREFEESARHIERLLSAAQIEMNLLLNHTTRGSYDSIPERQLRPLTGLQPEIQREIWMRAVATAPEGKLTADHVQSTVAQVHGIATHNAGRAQQVLDEDSDAPSTVTLRVARVIYLLTMGKHMELSEIADKTGLTENGAWRLMNRLEGGHHVPVRIDGEGQWCVHTQDAQGMPY